MVSWHHKLDGPESEPTPESVVDRNPGVLQPGAAKRQTRLTG